MNGERDKEYHLGECGDAETLFGRDDSAVESSDERVIALNRLPYFLYSAFPNSRIFVPLDYLVLGSTVIKPVPLREKLTLGEDIEETPLPDDFYLSVRSPSDDCPYRAVIEKCRFFAEISGHPFFSLSAIDGNVSRFLCSKDGFDISEVKPRLFKLVQRE